MQKQPGFSLGQLKALLNTISCAVSIFRINDRKPIFLNEAYYKLAGYNQDEYDRSFAEKDTGLFFPTDKQREKELEK